MITTRTRRQNSPASPTLLPVLEEADISLVIFTKRATSIVPNGHPIFPHPKATTMLDYEGELAIIVGKAGLGIPKEDAWDYVWGATIVNDVRSACGQAVACPVKC